MSFAEECTFFFRYVRLFFVIKALKKGEKMFVPINVIMFYRGSRGIAPHIMGIIRRKHSTLRSARFTPRDTNTGIH